MDDKSSEGEQENLSGDSSGASYSSAEIDGNNLSDSANCRRSRRKKKKSKVRGNNQRPCHLPLCCITTF